MNSISLEVRHWDLKCGVLGDSFPLSHGLALHCPVHCTFLMNLFEYIFCRLSYLNAKDFTSKLTQYEALEGIVTQCHEYADCISWYVFPVLYPCYTMNFEKTLLHFIICSLTKDCEFLCGSPYTCAYSQQ